MHVLLAGALGTLLIDLAAAVFSKWDKDGGFSISPQTNLLVLVGATAAAAVAQEQPYQITAGIFFFYLLFAAAMDESIQQVYDFLHLPVAVLLVGMFVWQRKYAAATVLLPLLVYVAFLLLQLVFRCYGLADTFVLGNCGLYLCMLKSRFTPVELLVYFLALTNVLFLVINTNNIQIKPVRLKKSAPYIPAIAAAMLLLLNL